MKLLAGGKKMEQYDVIFAVLADLDAGYIETHGMVI